MKKYIQLTLVLFIIAALSGMILAVVYDLTKEPIATVKAEKTKNGIQSIFADAVSFKEELVNNKNIKKYYVVYNIDIEQEQYVNKTEPLPNPIGYVFEVDTPDSFSGIVVLVGVDTEGKVTGTSYISITETPGLGVKVDPSKTDNHKDSVEFNEQFIGKTEVNVDNSDTISGATISSKSVINGIELALKYYNKNLNSN